MPDRKGFFSGHKHTPESKLKMRLAKLGKPGPWAGKTRGPHTEEWRRKIAVAGLGRTHSAESRAKISQKLIGHVGAFVGRTHTTATREKLRRLNRGQAPKHTARVPYGAYVFRSGFEVRAAKAFDTLGVKWEYEPKRFDLGYSTYAPDFYLPDDGCYWEIKGWYGPDSQKKVEAFRAQYPDIPLVLLGKRGLKILERAAKAANKINGVGLVANAHDIDCVLISHGPTDDAAAFIGVSSEGD